jgi:TusA-related sulfurtransferase
MNHLQAMKQLQEMKQSKTMKQLQAMERLAVIAGDETIKTNTSDDCNNHKQ